MVKYLLNVLFYVLKVRIAEELGVLPRLFIEEDAFYETIQQ